MMQIVHKTSAVLDVLDERKYSVPADHSNMCEFKDETDSGYENVSESIAELVEDAMEVGLASNRCETCHVCHVQ